MIIIETLLAGASPGHRQAGRRQPGETAMNRHGLASPLAPRMVAPRVTIALAPFPEIAVADASPGHVFQPGSSMTNWRHRRCA